MRLQERIRDSAAVIREVFRNPNLRWLELAWAAGSLAQYAFLIAVSVYAFDAGGDKAVGLLLLVRLVPAALLSPFAGMLGDRFRRELVMLVTNIVRTALVAAAAVCVYLDAPHVTIYALSVATMIASTPYHAAEGALTPTLATSPGELTAANAVASGVDSLAFFVGPALAGLLLGVVSTAAVFGLLAVFLAVSVVFIALIKPESEASEHPQGELASSTIVTEALAGFRAIATDSSLRVMMGLLTAQTFITGAMAVYIVVTAIQLVDLGSSGVGYLSSALGVGAFIGAVGALSLTGARRLGTPFLLGVVFWGLPLIIVGLWPSAAIALIMFGVIGVSNSVADVAGFTIIQRAVPDEVLARVFGVIQMLLYSSMGIGAVLAPALISWLGIQNALIATGAVLPVLVALSWTRVAGIDAAAKAPEPDELRLLGRTPIFAPLAGTSLEQVATRLVPHRLEPGTVIIREGDKGDRFYIVAEGKVQVSQEGQPISELEAGGYFGEIALLRDMPRTATVTSLTPVVLYSLDRPDFLAAVTGHAASADAAETVVSARLAGVASTGRRSSTA